MAHSIVGEKRRRTKFESACRKHMACYASIESQRIKTPIEVETMDWEGKRGHKGFFVPTSREGWEPAAANGTAAQDSLIPTADTWGATDNTPAFGDWGICLSSARVVRNSQTAFESIVRFWRMLVEDVAGQPGNGSY